MRNTRALYLLLLLNQSTVNKGEKLPSFCKAFQGSFSLFVRSPGPCFIVRRESFLHDHVTVATGQKISITTEKQLHSVSFIQWSAVGTVHTGRTGTVPCVPYSHAMSSRNDLLTEAAVALINTMIHTSARLFFRD